MAKKEELVAGIKNAIDRGQSVEDAIKSLILAGYDEVEVNEAAAELQRIQLGGEMKSVGQTAFEVEKESMDKKMADIKKANIKKSPLKLIIWIVVIIVVLLIGAAGFLYIKYMNPDLSKVSELLDKFLKLIKVRS